MKRYLFLILCFTFTLSYAQNFSITKAYLVNSKWSDLMFSEEGEVSNFGYFGGGINGTYYIKDNTVVITFHEGNHFELEKFKNRKTVYRLVKIQNEIFTDRLVTDDSVNYSPSFINFSSRVPEGTILQVEPGIELYVLNPVKAKALTNVKVRDYPGMESNVYTIYYENETHDYYKQGLILTVEGRTKNKYKVNAYENYWYMVGLEGLDEYETYRFKDKKINAKTKYTWIYGEFIQFEK